MKQLMMNNETINKILLIKKIKSKILLINHQCCHFYASIVDIKTK